MRWRVGLSLGPLQTTQLLSFLCALETCKQNLTKVLGFPFVLFLGNMFKITDVNKASISFYYFAKSLGSLTFPCQALSLNCKEHLAPWEMGRGVWIKKKIKT